MARSSDGFELPPAGDPLDRSRIAGWLRRRHRVDDRWAGRVQRALWRRARRLNQLGAGLMVAAVAVLLTAFALGGRLQFGATAALIGAAVGLLFLSSLVFSLLGQFGINQSRNQTADRRLAQLDTGELTPLATVSEADGDGLLVGDVLRHRVDWWQLVQVEDGDEEWRVHWTNGTFRLSKTAQPDRRLARVIHSVLEARAAGHALPDEPAGQDVPDGAISRARLTGEGEPDRGLSLTEGRDA